MDKIHNACPSLLLFVIPQARTAWRDASLWRHASHFSEHNGGTTDGTRTVMHQMKIARNPVDR
jgi:hypothetical protein